jgi:hypothetical protein
MTEYSTRYSDARGWATHLEADAFAADEDAISHARNTMQSNFMVEVWNGNDLVARIMQPDSQDRVGAVS